MDGILNLHSERYKLLTSTITSIDPSFAPHFQGLGVENSLSISHYAPQAVGTDKTAGTHTYRLLCYLDLYYSFNRFSIHNHSPL